MRGRNRWWILVLAVVVLGITACTENDLDESEANVVLEITGINNPAVTGDIGAGTCSLNAAIICLDNSDCVDQAAGFCEFALCTVADWVVDVRNQPLNEGGMESPFNDIVVSSVRLTYLNIDGSSYAVDSIVPLSATIEANGTGVISFAPIAFNDLTTDNTTINVLFAFVAQTVAGQAVNIAGGTGAQLFIEDCLP